MTGLELRAHAKVNLHLRVLGRRADGFHELLTVFHALPVHDTVRVALRPRAPGAPAGEPDIALTVRFEPLPGAAPWLPGPAASANGATPDEPTGTGAAGDVAAASRGPRHGAGDPPPGLPLGADNLAHRAAARFLRGSGAGGDIGVGIDLVKRLPAGGGLAGGSSDAAAVLVALNRLLGRPLAAAGLARMAAALGSDVPFFLLGGTALGTGRGELVRPIAPPRPLPFTLLLPAFGTATPAVYAAHAAARSAGEPLPEAPDLSAAELAAAFADADADTLRALFRNDLAPAACRVEPRLARLLSASGLLLSGSGSTLFAPGDLDLKPPPPGHVARPACAGALICRSQGGSGQELAETFPS